MTPLANEFADMPAYEDAAKEKHEKEGPIDIEINGEIGQNAFKSLFDDLAKNGYKAQSLFAIKENDFEDFLKKCRSGLNTIDKIGSHPIIKRVTAITSFMLVQGTLKPLGLDLKELNYNELERAAMKAKYSSKKDYAMCVLDVSLFIVERAYQVYKTGQWSTLLHSGATYESWFDKAMEVKRKSVLLSTCKLHGFTVYEFIADIKECIEIGENIVRFPATDCKFEMKSVKTLLHELKNIDASELTKRAAGKSRDAPFASLLVGHSGIGKSGIQEILKHAYTSYFGLPEGEEYVYYRNSADDYVSGYNTSKHTTIMDDIGAKRAGTGEDKSLNDILAFINNVATITNQADLPDKGRIPFVSEHVIATSNQSDLNAGENFEHPAAVLRRFPIVIEVRVKDEFAKDGFLDKSKAVPPTDGSFPNFWNFHVKKFETYFQHQRQLAKAVPVVGENGENIIYDNTDDFVKHYLSTAEFHKRCQIQAKSAYGALAKMCRTCKMTVNKCTCIKPQAADDNGIETPNWQDASPPPSGWKTICKDIAVYSCVSVVKCWGYTYTEWGWGNGIINFMLRQYLVRYYIWSFLSYMLPCKDSLKIIGTMIERRKTMKSLEMFVKVLGACVLAYGVYYGTSKIIDKVKPKTYTTQGNINTIGKPAKAKTEEESNVWHNVDIRTTPQDVSLKTKSLSHTNLDELRIRLQRNIVRIHIQYDEGKRYVQEAICLKGQKYIGNYHAFATHHTDGTPVKCYNITVDLLPSQEGINQSYFVKLYPEDLFMDKAKDVVLFELSGVPPKKDITDLLPNETFNCLVNGELIKQDSWKQLVKVTLCWSPPGMPTDCQMVTYRCPQTTEDGDCGSMILGHCPRGPVFLGFHGYIMNNTTQSFGTFLTKEYIDDILTKFRPQSMTIVDFEPASIALDLVEGERTIGPIHPKSVVSYVEEGVANVYGTVSGFRNRPRSKVCDTPKRGLVEKIFNKTSEYGKPVMRGWNYLRKNLIPLVSKKSLYKRSTLIKVRNSFIVDIIAELDKNDPEWREKLHPLDNYSTVNGQPGVKFIDALNFNSSMGNPFNKAKKNFVHDDPREGYPEGRNFDEIVWDRVQKMADNYSSKQRYMPVFNVHPKDEATANAKIEEEKTRLFMCGPIDYTLFTRKYLLNFVRLVQNNKFTFESGPGTVCQSLEWQQLRDYLVEFGIDQIVAGDYKQFDKGMLADFILAAYYIIAYLYMEAGADEDTINAVCGIMYDTCFPVANFNGDIIEFFGSNPSGHPLTVIINGLVNALYVRYCYYETNPEKECDTFKQNVNLMTYGDDNIMGISKKCPWFNHTSIQSVLQSIGIVYTMSDKTSQSVPYVNIDDESFLKRKWRYDSDLDVYLCPLDEESIFKSLTVWVPSDSISPEAQFAAVVQSAMYEYFYYGREKFESMRKQLQEICYNDDKIKYYVSDTTFPTWEGLKEHFIRSSRGMTTLSHPHGLTPTIAVEC
jgi:hypothetical protein